MDRSLDSSVSIVTKTGRARFRLPAESRDVFLRQSKSRGFSCPHPPHSYSMGTRGFFPGI